MTKCWQHDPTKRPRFADLVSILLEVSKSNIYIGTIYFNINIINVGIYLIVNVS